MNSTADMKSTAEMAPELNISMWINSSEPLTLASLRGRPVLIHAFQMLCPGCVAHAIPQTEKAFRLFHDTDLAVIGLHTVFEHHAAMTPTALKAFVHEYRLSFPIGVDTSGSDGPIPETMKLYQMRGTPTTVLVGRDGRIVSHQFGQIDDMALGAMIASVLKAGDAASRSDDVSEAPSTTNSGCDEGSCTAT